MRLGWGGDVKRQGNLSKGLKEEERLLGKVTQGFPDFVGGDCRVTWKTEYLREAGR